MKHLFTYILTLLVLLGLFAFRGSSLNDQRIPTAGNFGTDPKSGLVIGKSPVEKFDELKQIVARLEKSKDRVEGLPLVERMYNDGESLTIVFGFKHGMFPIEILDERTIAVIRGVLEVLRSLHISIHVSSKKELVECFGVDSQGKVHMVNLNHLDFGAVRKAADKAIEIALSFIDDGSQY
jgi:hypothetical protein